MYVRTLIAYDGTDSAGNVLEQALILARSEQSRVDIVTVIPGYQGDLRLMGNTRVLDEVKDHYQTSLDTAGETAQTSGLRPRLHLKSGEPREEILELTARLRTDLLAIGKKAHFLLGTVPIGTVADTVVRESPADVLVISGDKKLNLERIFLAYDGTEGAKKAARKACSLAARYGAKLFIGLAYEMAMEAFSLDPDLETALREKARAVLEPVMTLARQADVQDVTAIIRHGNPAYQTLADAAKECSAGLIVAGAGGRGTLAQMILGSVTARLVALSACPVLVVKE